MFPCATFTDGLIHPAPGDFFSEPNGMSLRPRGTNMWDILSSYRGKCTVTILPGACDREPCRIDIFTDFWILFRSKQCFSYGHVCSLSCSQLVLSSRPSSSSFTNTAITGRCRPQPRACRVCSTVASHRCSHRVRKSPKTPTLLATHLFAQLLLESNFGPHALDLHGLQLDFVTMIDWLLQHCCRVW